MATQYLQVNMEWMGALDMQFIYDQFSESMHQLQGQINRMISDPDIDLSDINVAFDLQALMNNLTYLSTTASSVLKSSTEMLVGMARAMKQ